MYSSPRQCCDKLASNGQAFFIWAKDHKVQRNRSSRRSRTFCSALETSKVSHAIYPLINYLFSRITRGAKATVQTLAILSGQRYLKASDTSEGQIH